MEISVDVAQALKSAKVLLLKPRDFFRLEKKEKTWKSAFSFLLVIAFLGHILTAAYNLVLYPILSPNFAQNLDIPQNAFDPAQVLPAVVISYIITLILSFLWGGALKLWLSLFKVDSTFDQTYKVMVYSRTPNYLFGWAPFLNFFAAIYSLYLTMLALENEFGLARRRAITIVLTGMLVLMVISVLAVSLIPFS